MAKTEIRVGGLGGQGVILCGHIIGKAASIFDNKYATLIQAFGPEARGSACSASSAICSASENRSVIAPTPITSAAPTSHASQRPVRSR